MIRRSALQEWQQISSPEDADLRYDYIKALSMKKEFKTAFSLLDQASQIKYYEDSKHQFLLLKAEILAEDNQYEAALEVCNSCVEMETADFFNGEARFMAMNLQLAKPDYEESLRHADVLVKKNKEDLYVRIFHRKTEHSLYFYHNMIFNQFELYLFKKW